MQNHPITTDILRGAIELETTAQGVLPHRLPAWARQQCSDPQLAMVEAQPAGVRLVFRSEATVIELDAVCTRRVYVGAPARPDGLYDLIVDGQLVAQQSVTGGKLMTVDMSAGSMKMDTGPAGTVRFDGLPNYEKRIEIWLPYNEATELLALRTDAPIAPIADDGRKVWLHHGSSISHGTDAASPSTTWPAIAAAQSKVELINLGFGGSALLDPFVARVIRDTRADLISIKLGINLVNLDVMRLRAFGPAVHGFIDTIREGHPNTPLHIISPILCPVHEDTPGPSLPDMSALSSGKLSFYAAGNPAERAAGKLTLNVIRAELEKIVKLRAVDDAHLFYLDGRELYGEADAQELPLPDNLHPDAATHRRMGERYAGLVLKACEL